MQIDPQRQKSATFWEASTNLSCFGSDTISSQKKYLVVRIYTVHFQKHYISISFRCQMFRLHFDKCMHVKETYIVILYFYVKVNKMVVD